MKKLLALLTGAVAVLGIAACSGVDYIDSSKLRKQPVAAFDDGDTIKVPKQFGAIRFNHNTEEVEDDTVFVFKRRKSHYMAETTLFEDSKRAGFFNFGIDYKKKLLGFGFRLEF